MIKVLFLNSIGEYVYENMRFRPNMGDNVLNFNISPPYKIDAIYLFPSFYLKPLGLKFDIDKDTDMICLVS